MPQLYYKTSSGTLVAIGTTAVTNDTTKVSTSGNESISGTKTFTGSVVLPSTSATSKITAFTSNTSMASLNIPAGTAPTSPSDGDIWNTTNGLYYRNNSINQHIPRVTVSNTAPSTPVDGDLWVDTSVSAFTVNRNLIDNGAMQIAQRGTTTVGSITTGSINMHDRWYFAVNAGTWQQSNITTTPSNTMFRNALQIQLTSAAPSIVAGSFAAIEQRFEGQFLQQLMKGTTNALPLTLSFWVRSTTTGTYNVEIEDSTNTRHAVSAYTISAANTWEFKTITFSADTTGQIANDNAQGMRLIWWLAAGTNFTSGTRPTGWAAQTSANRAVSQTNLASATNNNWSITGVQLEAGSTASPFEMRPYDQELQKCQRYYYRLNASEGSGNFTNFFYGRWDSATRGYGSLPLPVKMRSTQVIGFSALGDFLVGDSNNGVVISGLGIDMGHPMVPSFYVDYATGGRVAGRALTVYSNNKTTTWLAIGSEI